MGHRIPEVEQSWVFIMLTPNIKNAKCFICTVGNISFILPDIGILI
jgi:hypothetical protein